MLQIVHPVSILGVNLIILSDVWQKFKPDSRKNMTSLAGGSLMFYLSVNLFAEKIIQNRKCDAGIICK